MKDNKGPYKRITDTGLECFLSAQLKTLWLKLKTPSSISHPTSYNHVLTEVPVRVSVSDRARAPARLSRGVLQTAVAEERSRNPTDHSPFFRRKCAKGLCSRTCFRHTVSSTWMQHRVRQLHLYLMLTLQWTNRGCIKWLINHTTSQQMDHYDFWPGLRMAPFVQIQINPEKMDFQTIGQTGMIVG